MEPRFLDTDILLRYLTQDDDEKAERAFALLERVGLGEEQVETSLIVLFEVVFTLHRQYRIPREQIRAVVRPVILLQGLRLDGKEIFLRALDLFVAYRADFADAHNVAVTEARGIASIYSWDQGFDRFPNVARVEPETVADAE